MVDNIFIITVCFPSQVTAERSHGDNRQTLQELQQENLLQTLPSGPSSPGPRHRWSQHRLQGVLPPPEPEEDPELFILDLRNFPELANADMGSQNPNIQVGSVHVALIVSLEAGLGRSSRSTKGSYHHRSAGVPDYTGDHRRWGVMQPPSIALSSVSVLYTMYLSLAPYIPSLCAAGLSQDRVLSYHMQDL